MVSRFPRGIWRTSLVSSGTTVTILEPRSTRRILSSKGWAFPSDNVGKTKSHIVKYKTKRKAMENTNCWQNQFARHWVIMKIYGNCLYARFAYRACSVKSSLYLPLWFSYKYTALCESKLLTANTLCVHRRRYSLKQSENKGSNTVNSQLKARSLHPYKIAKSTSRRFLNLSIIFWELGTTGKMDICSAFVILYHCDFDTKQRDCGIKYSHIIRFLQ